MILLSDCRAKREHRPYASRTDFVFTCLCESHQPLQGRSSLYGKMQVAYETHKNILPYSNPSAFFHFPYGTLGQPFITSLLLEMVTELWCYQKIHCRIPDKWQLTVTLGWGDTRWALVRGRKISTVGLLAGFMNSSSLQEAEIQILCKTSWF